MKKLELFNRLIKLQLLQIHRPLPTAARVLIAAVLRSHVGPQPAWLVTHGPLKPHDAPV